MEYLDKLIGAAGKSGSLLCVGLDPNPDLMPESLKMKYEDPQELVVRFCREIIDATHESCCAFKPNLAFFEALGPGGLTTFKRVLDQVPDGKIVIADAKRGDIGSTADQYKKAFFDHFGVDAITLNPLMGFDTIEPFTADASKAVYSLVLTSNPGSRDLLLRRFEGKDSLAVYIADQLRLMMNAGKSHIGMVVGATHPSFLGPVLAAYPQASLLIPGVGSQGGKIGDLYPLLENHRGIPVITSSRSIIYAGGNRPNWKDDVARSAKKLKTELQPLGRRFF